MDEGEIEVDSIKPIGLPDITGQLARESGFLGVVDLLKVAKHGKGENIRSEWTKVRSRWIRSSQSVFRISLGSWRASRVSWASWICSRWRSTVKARTSIWFGSTMCGHVGSGLDSASRPDCPDYREGARLVRHCQWGPSTLV